MEQTNRHRWISCNVEPNRLVQESSPYLLQHAYNPVHWYPWCDEALKKAKEENKPIFLSIGYSACHWCHVMAHESFENEEIADVMNKNFVNIKVDREERPDIDDIYQKVCQLTTGSGGWPLSVFLTPDGKPFYVGTYFPPLGGFGRPGFGSVLRQLAQAWREKPKDVESAASDYVGLLERKTPSIPTKLTRSLLDEAAVNLLSLADQANGGFGHAPKFPNSANLSFMLRYHKLSGISKFQEFCTKTLSKMARGGIFDQIGGGFHRYSTDSKWLVPHFEKMLYDNALLPVVYAEAYQLTKDPLYLDVIMRTLQYVLDEMTSPEGAFYSAQDADSEGEEGKYYVWTKKEILTILGSDAEAFCLYYDVTDGGNFEGRTILQNNLSMSSTAFHFGKSESEVSEILQRCREKLLEERKKRVKPGRDEKILLSWNSLMVSGLLRCYRVTRNEKFLAAAEKCIRFIDEKMTNGSELMHSYKDGKAKFRAYLDDYSYFIQALLDYFEIRPSKHSLNLAVSYSEYLLNHFWDKNEGGFFFTADNHEKLIARTKSLHDLSLPSGNSVAAGVLLRLYRITSDERYMGVSLKILESLSVEAAENPFGFGYLLNVIYAYLNPSLEITILNTINEDLCSFLEKQFLPDAMIISVKNEEVLYDLQNLSLFSGKVFSDKKTQVYVCRDSVCSLPVEHIDDVKNLV